MIFHLCGKRIEKCQHWLFCFRQWRWWRPRLDTEQHRDNKKSFLACEGRRQSFLWAGKKTKERKHLLTELLSYSKSSHHFQAMLRFWNEKQTNRKCDKHWMMFCWAYQSFSSDSVCFAKQMRHRNWIWNCLTHLEMEQFLLILISNLTLQQAV